MDIFWKKIVNQVASTPRPIKVGPVLISAKGLVPSYGANLSVGDQPYNSKLWRQCRLNQTYHISEKKILS